MTTDRTAAPTRGTAFADRVAANGRTQAPPTDAFSALLAAAPKSDTPRREERPLRRDDSPRWDEGPRHIERRPNGPKHDEYRRPADADAKKDAPASDAIDTSCDPEETPETPAAAITPSLFALQLASPLPPVATAATAAVPVPAAPATPVEAAPVLPVLPSIVPASLVTATAPVTGEVAATPEPTAPAAVAASALTSLLAGTSAEAQPAEGEVTLPETPLKSPLQGAGPAAATPQDAAATAQPQTGGDGQPDGQPHTPTPAPVPTAAAPAAQPKVEAAAEPAPVTAGQPVSPTPTSAPIAPAARGLPNVERAVPLSRAVPTTGVLIHLASERGVTHARLNLKPVELGGIEVKLHSTPAGIHAQLIADSPEAARMLQQAGDDLKRQLEDRDVNLLSLDVSTSGDQRDEQPRFADGFGDDHRPGGYPGTHRGPGEDTVLMESPVAADTVLVLPDGVHVDVLA